MGRSGQDARPLQATWLAASALSNAASVQVQIPAAPSQSVTLYLPDRMRLGIRPSAVQKRGGERYRRQDPDGASRPLLCIGSLGFHTEGAVVQETASRWCSQ